MNDRQDGNFLDSRTMLAIVLVGVVWFGWQTYLAKKYPDLKKTQATEARVNPEAMEPLKTTPTVVGNENTSQLKAPAGAEEKTLKYEDKNISLLLSSEGMALKEFTLKNHKNRTHELMKMGLSIDGKGLFGISLLDSPLPIHFNISRQSENSFQGTAQIGQMKIVREIDINPETEATTNRVFITNAPSDFRGLSVRFPEKRVDYSSGGNFLIPSFEHQEFMISHEGTETRLNSTSSKVVINQTFSNVSLVAINSQYFSSAVLDKSEIIPEAKVLGGLPEEELVATLSYRVQPSNRTDYKFEWISYSGAKAMTTLEKIDPAMTKVINHGFFATIARTLLVLLKWFHSVVGNWGVSIILLTLLVRILVLPLNITTFRSTKKMQKIQPLIASLRERYKDDPTTMNKEMMALWKEHKVNPVGGCLPMLLQLPVFFALYQVLGQSIELYQAPFFLWITDLSLKDPFYILPILMAGAMYLQQKMTPTTMDPTQAKIMQFLPLIFALMMISLPAGLTLYILVNTVTGVGLQQLFMRDRSKSVTSMAAKA
jgi:YidC/Oxa1 family membrane protein insertase